MRSSTVQKRISHKAQPLAWDDSKGKKQERLSGILLGTNVRNKSGNLGQNTLWMITVLGIYYIASPWLCCISMSECEHIFVS